MGNLMSSPAFDEFDGDFNGELFGLKLTNAKGSEIRFSMTPEQAAQLVYGVFRLAYDWQQKNAPAGSKPTDIPVDALVPVHGLGLAQGIDAQHATVVVGSGPLTVGFHTEISKIARVCEALQNAPRVPLDDPQKPQKH